MPSQKANQPVNTFVKGLITEVSPLSYPEGGSLDEINFKLKRDGTRERRLGLDYEDDYALVTDTTTASNVAYVAQKAFRWPSPNGSNKVDIGVIQVGNKLWFCNLLTANPSANLLNGGNYVEIGISGTKELSFAIINGYLVAFSEEISQPAGISYNDDTDTITYSTAPVTVRDMWGIDDGLGDTERPTVLSDAHKYNLRNQGWTEQIRTTGNPGEDVLDYVFRMGGAYPSHSDQWGIGRINDLTDANVYLFDSAIAYRNQVDIGRVPKGHYVLDIFNRGTYRNALTGITCPLDKEESYFSTICTYAGRIWYSGCRGVVSNGDSKSPIMSSAILYSQVMESGVEVTRCYQKADPTSYEFNEVVDTDGGFIQIQEAYNIVRIFPVKSSLFIFAENGVWEIRGGDEGFKATSFQINRISNVGVYSRNSIVDIGGQVFFWAIDGIYSIVPNAQLANVWETVNVTQPTIQRMYNSLPDLVKQNARGFYDLRSNTARWLYTSDYPKIVGDPIDIQPPAEPTNVFNIGPIAAGQNSTYQIVTRIDDTRYMIIYYNNAGPVYTRGVICTVDPAAQTVTMGTPVDIFASSYSDRFMNAFLLTTNKIVFFGAKSGVGHIHVVLTISGTTFTVGAENNILTASLFSPQMMAGLTATTALQTYTYSGQAYATLLTISGDVVTSSGTIPLSTSTGTGNLYRLTNSKAFAMIDAYRCCVVQVSGGVVSYGAIVNFTDIDPSDPAPYPNNIIFWSLGDESYIGQSNSTGSSIVLHANSLNEAPTHLMLRTFTISGTTISTNYQSKYISNPILLSNADFSHHYGLCLNDTIDAYVFIKYDSGGTTRHLYCGTTYYTTTSNTTKDSPTLVSSSFNTHVQAARLSDTIMVWVSNIGPSPTWTGPLNTGAIQIA